MSSVRQQYTPLELTAVHAIACKSSAHRRGYQDGHADKAAAVASDAAAPNCPKKNYQTPLLNRMYYCRVIVIRALLAAAVRAAADGGLSTVSGCSRKIQLLVLGAGFELFEHMPANVTVFLVDLPGITAARRAAEADTGSNMRLVAADLRDPAQLMHNLSLAGFVRSDPSIILLESVLSYINKIDVDNLLQMLYRDIPSVTLLVYDVTLPASRGGFSAYTQKSFGRGKAPLLSARGSPLDFSINLRRIGWAHSCCCSVQQALKLFVSKEKALMSMALEPFDEFSALAVLNEQYIVAWAGSNADHFQSIIQGTAATAASPAPAQDNDQDAVAAQLSVGADEEGRRETVSNRSVSSSIDDRLRNLEARIDILLTRVIALTVAGNSNNA